MGKEKPKEDLSEQEIAERERRVLDHFLSSKPKPHKPVGKKTPRKRRKKKVASAA